VLLKLIDKAIAGYHHSLFLNTNAESMTFMSILAFMDDNRFKAIIFFRIFKIGGI